MQLRKSPTLIFLVCVVLLIIIFMYHGRRMRKSRTATLALRYDRDSRPSAQPSQAVTSLVTFHEEPASRRWGDDQTYNHVWSWPVVINHHLSCVGNTTARKYVSVPHQNAGEPISQFIILRHSKVGGKQPIPADLAPFLYCPHGRTMLYYTSDRRKYLRSASIVEFHDAETTLSDIPNKAFAEQLFMLLSWESPVHKQSHVHSGEMMKRYNLRRSYRLDSDLVLSRYPTCIMERMSSEVVNDFHRHSVTALFISQDCRSTNGRERYVQQLMQYTDVHSQGKCLHNMKPPNSNSDWSLPHYRFYLALENCQCQDYITDKLIQCWEKGVIPIVSSYRGQPDYTVFAPNANSYLNIGHFKSPSALAERMMEIASDKKTYLSYLEYRRSPQLISSRFKRYFAPRGDDDAEGWCRLIYRIQNPEELHRMSKRTLTADKSCAPEYKLAG